MICPDCGFDNIDGVDACDECGQSLVQFDPSGTELEQVICRHAIDVLCPKAPVTVESSVSARAAIQKMVAHKIGCLLVEEAGKLVGIFTERDVLNKVSGDLARLDAPVAELMTRNPLAISRRDSIAYTLHAMDLGAYRHMPVVDKSGSPKGIISVRDILRFLCIRFAELGSQAG